MANPVYAARAVPADCDLCQRPIGQNYIDGMVKEGGWATMCLGCHRVHGFGLGAGRGRHFEKQEDGRWLKIEG
jgi:hypothetical protein